MWVGWFIELLRRDTERVLWPGDLEMDRPELQVKLERAGLNPKTLSAALLGEVLVAAAELIDGACEAGKAPPVLIRFKAVVEGSAAPTLEAVPVPGELDFGEVDPKTDAAFEDAIRILGGGPTSSDKAKSGRRKLVSIGKEHGVVISVQSLSSAGVKSKLTLVKGDRPPYAIRASRTLMGKLTGIVDPSSERTSGMIVVTVGPDVHELSADERICSLATPLFRQDVICEVKAVRDNRGESCEAVSLRAPQKAKGLFAKLSALAELTHQLHLVTDDLTPEGEK
jgi:hypothetical protein